MANHFGKTLTLGQASRIADCSRDTLRRAAQKEELKAELAPGRKGQQWYIRSADLTDWMQSRGIQPNVPATPASDTNRLEQLEQEVARYRERAEKDQEKARRAEHELKLAQQRAEHAVAQLQVAAKLIESLQPKKRSTVLRRMLRKVVG